MKDTQLFKRIHTLTLEELSLIVKYDEDVHAGILRLKILSQVRHIVDFIQLEDMWQQRISEDANDCDYFLQMKLSPKALGSAFELNKNMNALEWQFVLPKYESIQDAIKPETFGDYISLLKQVNINDIAVEYTIEDACIFLDAIYDFQKNGGDNSPNYKI